MNHIHTDMHMVLSLRNAWLVFALNLKNSSNFYVSVKRKNSFPNTGKHKCRAWNPEIVQGTIAYGET